MSTRSAIGYMAINGDIHAVYCHFDGYLAHNGSILDKNYREINKIKKIVKTGDLSILREEICPHNNPINKPTNIECEINNWCVFYDNDRVMPRLFSSPESLIEYFSRAGCDFIYLYGEKEKDWIFCEVNTLTQDWKNLTESLKSASVEVDLSYNICDR